MTAMTIPFSEYRRIFGASDAVNSQKALKSFERSFGPIQHQRLSPLVLVFLVYAPQHRELARQLLQNHASLLKTLVLIVTPSHALCTLSQQSALTASASNCAWALVDFEAQRTCVMHQAPGVELLTHTASSSATDLSGALAHAMDFVDLMPQAAMLYFGSMRQALHNTSMGHIDPAVMRWARKHPILASKCPVVATPPPPPPQQLPSPSATPSYAKRTICVPDVPKAAAAPAIPSVMQRQFQERIAQQKPAIIGAKKSNGNTLRRQQKLLRNSLKNSGILLIPKASAVPSKRKLKSSWELLAAKKKSEATQLLRLQFIQDVEGGGDDDLEAELNVIMQQHQPMSPPRRAPPLCSEYVSTLELMAKFNERAARVDRL